MVSRCLDFIHIVSENSGACSHRDICHGNEEMEVAVCEWSGRQKSDFYCKEKWK